MQANKLTISANQEKSLSKSQAKFNKLVAEIEKLKVKKVTLEQQIKEVEITVHKKVLPLIFESKEVTFKMLKNIDFAYDNFKLAKGEQEAISRFIVSTIKDMSNMLEQMGEEMTEMDELLTKHRNILGDDYEDENDVNSEDMIAEALKNMFGLDIDMEKIKNGDEDYIAEKQREFHGGKERKKSKKQLAAEEKEKEAEDKMKKDTRTIYTQLAKQLHPDTEQDETKRDAKTELMKRVTNAYSNNDLYELLQIQMEVDQLNADSLSGASDDTMDSYIKVLQKQVNEIRHEIEYKVKAHPVYQQFFDDFKERFVESRIRKQVKELKDGMQQLSDMSRAANDKNSFKAFAKELKAEYKAIDSNPFGSIFYFF
jgi:hypothetical protein